MKLGLKLFPESTQAEPWCQQSILSRNFDLGGPKFGLSAENAAPESSGRNFSSPWNPNYWVKLTQIWLKMIPSKYSWRSIMSTVNIITKFCYGGLQTWGSHFSEQHFWQIIWIGSPLYQIFWTILTVDIMYCQEYFLMIILSHVWVELNQ